MDLKELCCKIELPKEAEDQVMNFDRIYRHEIFSDSCKKLYERDTWEEGIQELEERLGEDPLGMKILTCLLHCALDAYTQYEIRNIPPEIYLDTMKFISRFLEQYKKVYGCYAFVWAWWFPRQLSLAEFRIGELEYEMRGEEGKPQIFIHIPSDAVLEKECLDVSHKASLRFFERFFPAYAKAPFYCKSWLLSPALKKLLPENSRILKFQDAFEILEWHKESDSYMQWLNFKKEDAPGNWPEETSLQRNAKNYLRQGGRIGDALGILCGFSDDCKREKREEHGFQSI